MKLYNQCVLLLVVDKQTIDCLPRSIQKDIIKMRVYFKLWYKCYYLAMDFSSKTLKLRMARYKIESKQSNCFWRWRYTKRIQDDILIQILQDEENDSYMKFISTVHKWIQCRKNVDPHLQDIERKLYQTFDPYNAFIGLL